MKYELKIAYTEAEEAAGITAKRVALFLIRGGVRNQEVFNGLVDATGSELGPDNSVRVEGRFWIVSGDRFTADVGHQFEVEISNINPDGRESVKVETSYVHKEKVLDPQPVVFVPIWE